MSMSFIADAETNTITSHVEEQFCSLKWIQQEMERMEQIKLT